MWIRHNRKLLIVILVLVAVTLLGACGPGTPQPRGWSGVTITDGTLVFGSRDGRIVEMEIATGARLWTATLGVQRTGGAGCGAAGPTIAIYGTPAVKENMVYTGAYVQEGNLSHGKVFAFITGQTEPRWLYPRDGFLSGPVVGGMLVGQDRVYFGASDGKVYALDAIDGHKIAEYQTGDKIWSTPAISGDKLYIGSFDKRLYVLDAATLQPVDWQSFPTEGAIAATPTINNGTIYIGSFDRNLYAIDAASGAMRWKFPAGNWFWAQPIVANGTVYALCLDNRVYILDAATGAEKAPAVVLDKPVSSSPVLVENRLIIASESGKLYSLDVTNNQSSELADLNQTVYAPLAAAGGTVYVHTDADSLFAVEIATGAVRSLVFR